MASNFTDFQSFVGFVISSILAPLVPALFAVALALFLYGVFKFVASAGNDRGRESGRQFILYGLFGLFVMLSVWGLVQILTNTFGVRFGVPQF